MGTTAAAKMAALVMISVGVAVPASAGDLKIPPEVTPALRAACESDARRLCIREESTVASIKQCMLENFLKLGNRCRVQITLAGLAP